MYSSESTFSSFENDAKKIRNERGFQGDIQWKNLKHSFQFQKLPENSIVRIHLDHHSSTKHLSDLARFTEDLPRLLEQNDLKV